MKSENLRTPSDTVKEIAVYEKDFQFLIRLFKLHI